MKFVCKFCEKADIIQHRPSLSIDISKAVESGTITSSATVEEFNHLDIDSLDNSTRLREVFDGVEHGQKLYNSFNEYSSGTGNTTVSTVSTSPEESSAN